MDVQSEKYKTFGVQVVYSLCCHRSRTSAVDMNPTGAALLTSGRSRVYTQHSRVCSWTKMVSAPSKMKLESGRWDAACPLLRMERAWAKPYTYVHRYKPGIKENKQYNNDKTSATGIARNSNTGLVL